MNKYSWRKKTDAKIVTISRLKRAIREENSIALGLAGFSGSFSRNERTDAESITQRVLELMLRGLLETLDSRSVCFISGATNLGVPRLGYAAAKQLGLTTVGITAESAIRYSLAELDYLTVVGKQFGDESEAFVSTLDALWVVGGGAQSLSECKLAIESRIPVTVFQGIGGVADHVCSDTLDAKFVNIDEYLFENE